MLYIYLPADYYHLNLDVTKENLLAAGFSAVPAVLLVNFSMTSSMPRRDPQVCSSCLTQNLRKLRSSANGPFLEQPTSRLHKAGDRSFSVASQLWNELPFELRTCKTVETFKRLLKSHLFRKAHDC